MRNYFNYFTEIEERFQQRRGSILLLSTLDWALIETWREAGIPIEAALRGIDAAFDKYEARQKRGRMRRINGLAWCAQAVMDAAVEMNEAAAGTASASAPAHESGFEHERVAAHLESAAAALASAAVAPEACAATAARLRELAAELRASSSAGPDAGADMEALERSLTVLEENSSPRSPPPHRKNFSSASRSTPRASSRPIAAAWAPCSFARWSASSCRSSCSYTTTCRASASFI